MGPGQYAWHRFVRILKIFVGSAALTDILATIVVIGFTIVLGFVSRPVVSFVGPVLNFLQGIPVWLVPIPVIALAAIRLFVANYKEHRALKEEKAELQEKLAEAERLAGATHITTSHVTINNFYRSPEPGVEVPAHPQVRIQNGDSASVESGGQSDAP